MTNEDTSTSEPGSSSRPERGGCGGGGGGGGGGWNGNGGDNGCYNSGGGDGGDVVVCGRVGGLLTSLGVPPAATTTTTTATESSAVMMRSGVGHEVVRRSLVFLLALALAVEYSTEAAAADDEASVVVAASQKQQQQPSPPRYTVTVEHHVPTGYLCYVHEGSVVSGTGSSSSSSSSSDDHDDRPPVEVTEEMLHRLRSRMSLLVSLDLPIWEETVGREEALRYFESCGRGYTVSAIRAANSPEVRVYRCDVAHNIQDSGTDNNNSNNSSGSGSSITRFMALHMGQRPLVPRTGVLCGWGLSVRERHGLVLELPEDPLSMSYVGQKDNMMEMVREYNTWSWRLGVRCTGDLSRVIRAREMKHYTQLYQTLHYQKLAKIAGQIAAAGAAGSGGRGRGGGAKLVLLAGPSASGKTTTSHLLCLQLEALGMRPMVISVDNYYKANKDCPRDSQGNPDFESLEALRVDLLNRHINQLFAGEEVEMPVFDFKAGMPKDVGRRVRMKAGGVLIVEGIHCLNPDLTPDIPSGTMFKIFVVPICQLNIDELNFIGGSVVRLLRRMVRDSVRRGHSAERTFQMWSGVRRAEHKYIFPFMKDADVVFNTSLDYEFSVLKVYAKPLLKGIDGRSPYYNKARELLQFLEHFDAVPHDHVPDTSLLREFIGGSFFEDVH